METMEEDKTKHDNLVKLGVEEQKSLGIRQYKKG
ncbi:hypothetical protein TheetDRAFT_2712 [Thermoanaerobacter ethanolicus JW 200]|nr:hypothetical protein TheetDRAFT_2712 [Thermoanaerobacter ethanolicus JW 200]